MPKEETAASAVAARGATEFSDNYRWYVVGILLLVHVFGHVDRQIMNVLVEPIKQEFGLSDTVMGLMTGAAFAIFYATLGLPLALWADRRNRRNMIAAAITAWSVMTVFCGMAVNAFQLILARIGVAVGEAGSNPASHSIIADLFPQARRATPMAVLAIGPNLGILLGFTIGGILSAAYDWRVAFIAAGVPGILIGLLVLLTVREPVRGQADGLASSGGGSLAELLRTIRARPSLFYIIAGFSFAAFFGYGAIAWLTAFFERSYGLSRAHIGPLIGLVVGIAGSAGTFSGGFLADRLGKRDVRWRVWVICVVGLAATPFAIAAFLVKDWVVTLALFTLPATIAVFHAGPSFALVQGLVDVKIRAIGAAFLLFAINLIGGALGPFYIGAVSDFLEPRFGIESLRYAILSVVWAIVASVLCYFLASRTLGRDLEQAHASQNSTR